MHIAHLLVSLDIGGSELVVTELTEAQASEHRVTVIARNGALQTRVLAAGAEHLDWPIGEKKLSTLGHIRRLRRWIGQAKPDVLHIHSRIPGWIARLALRRIPKQRRPAVVTTVHGHYSVNGFSAIMTWGDRLIAVSQSIADYIRQHYPQTPPGRIRIIPVGTSTEAFPPGHRASRDWLDAFHTSHPETRNKVWLTLPGRMTRLKGHAAFIRLIGRLVDRGIDVQGLIVGPVPPRKTDYHREITALAASTGLTKRLTFTGERHDMADIFSASGLVLNLSTKPEAFGRTIAEALTVGTPVVAWDYGGAAEILKDRFPTGAVKPGDEAALLNTVEALIRRPQRPQAGALYTLDAMADANVAVYRSALQSRRRPGTE